MFGFEGGELHVALFAALGVDVEDNPIRRPRVQPNPVRLSGDQRHHRATEQGV